MELACQIVVRRYEYDEHDLEKVWQATNCFDTASFSTILPMP
jgi:hypothetical protein